MKKIIRLSLLLLVLQTFASALTAQTLDYTTTKEKIYVQTNHVFFKPGETLFFKLYVVRGQDQRPTTVSNVVYAEVINPAGTVVQKLNLRVADGYAEGSYEFKQEAVGGVYKLRCYTSWMQNEEESRYFTKEVTVQKVIAPRVLMRLDFPEKGYGAGSEVWARFSIRNLNDLPIANHSGKFAVSIGGQVISTGTFTTDKGGKAEPKFQLPKELHTADGLLNMTVTYDGYTEAISRSIPIVLNKIDLQLMPEGGTLVQGIATTIAFKAVNERGKATDIKGMVVDQNGKEVTSIESYHFGMGRFVLKPESGKRYRVKITSPANITQTYACPLALNNGVVMNVTKGAGKLQVKLTTTDERNMLLTGETKGIRYYERNLSLKKGENILLIDEKIFPVGIAQFTLSTTEGMPLSERLCFLNEDRNLSVSISTDKKQYAPREKVTLRLRTVDEAGKPVPSNFSLSVVDDKLWTFADDKQDHLLSWLLLSSELQGKIEEPQFYFKKDEPKAVPALDLLMLTHGYRYFHYIDYVKKEGRVKFLPDQDNVLSGVIEDGKGTPVKATVFLVGSRKGEKALQIETDADGSFFFSGIAPNSTYHLFAQSSTGREKLVIKVLQQGIGFNPKYNAAGRGAAGDELSKFKPVIRPVRALQHDTVNEEPLARKELMAMRQQNLDEVVVTGYGTAFRKMNMTGAVSVIQAREILPAGNVGYLLQGRAAGISVVPSSNPGAAAKVLIRGVVSQNGNNQPLVVLDGIPVDGMNVQSVPVADIENITVLKDAAASVLYGSRGANGVIVIETKQFRTGRIRFSFSNKDYFASQTVQFAGTQYAVARRFYAPRYKSLEVEERTDFRETIFWNPVVQTDANGEAELSFYNSDASTTFRVLAEGIGFNGKLGRAEQTYVVRNAVAVDAKLPPYLTVGDKALLPLVVKNNSAQPLELTLTVLVPHNLTLGRYATTMKLEADSAGKLIVPIEATDAVNGTIRLVVSSQLGKETLVLPLVATEKGFPVIQTFSGNASVIHSFQVGKMIAGSLKTKLKLFKNLEGQLLDGIESMLREPYGCFEQTSSATYPNIFVLKYLRESGRSNPEIEKKALDYIEKGYKRLIGYETSQNGFEWFGKAPPHEALTAYGLLEFTDMQEFIDVDRKMLERTKKFLLDRRDGQGGFKLASGGYDRFASVPNKIANIYIVYALSQAGIGQEIRAEYNAAVKAALQSGDGYQMAMMTLAASNMKAGNDYRQLVDAARELYRTKALASETSVVNSRHASLKVETLSLYALALLREKNPDLGEVASVISKILGEKSYYGYGSTQATVLALNAVVEYSKLAGKLSDNTPVAFYLNNIPVSETDLLLRQIAEGKNAFAVQYTDNKTAVPYSLEVAYQTFTPPNSEKAELLLETQLAAETVKIGETVRLKISVTNKASNLQPMSIAKIGIPAGLSAQPWQLKEIMEKNEVAYYEIFDNYLVFYWMGFKGGETKQLNLDLKAEIAGAYKGKASNTYLYYTPEFKHWKDGLEVTIAEQ
ncbi:MAG TPA: TonB-dependent receptor plug domain-containing protein [Flavisolibacter sp.]|nr:TonB-dependent receptor plug domain-containing protein [Flavisolibacter sp.]